MRNLFSSAAVRHLCSVLVSVVLTVGLAKTGVLTPEQAGQIGTAAGAAVGGT